MNIKQILLLLLLFLPVIQAQGIESYDVELTLSPSGLVHQKIENTFSLGQDSDNVLFKTENEVQNIKVYDNQGLEFQLTDQGILITKQFTANVLDTINIEFDSKDFIKKSGKEFIFSYDFSIPFNSRQTKIKLTLPEGFVLADAASPISPKPLSIDTDGRLISIIWNTDKLEESFIVVYKRGFTSKTESLLPIYLLLALITALLTIIVTIKINRRKSRKFISGTLSDDENKITNLIKEDKDVTQKEISKLTGFSKSKMSKIVRRLDEKGVLKKKQFYKTNKFELSKRLR